MSATPAIVAPPLTPRGRRTREAIVAAARAVFEERGFPATRMSDIADAAGVSHGTVYTYFPTKDAVLREAVTSLVGEVYVALRGQDEADPVTRVADANRAYLAAYARHARMLAVVEQVATTEPWYAAVLRDLRAEHVGRAAVSIRRLQQEGLAADDLDAGVAAAAPYGMVEAFARHWLGRGEPHEEALAVDTLTRLWCRGIGLEPPAAAGRGEDAR